MIIQIKSSNIIYEYGNLETVEPTEDELSALKAYQEGDSEFTATLSSDDIMRELGL